MSAYCETVGHDWLRQEDHKLCARCDLVVALPEPAPEPPALSVVPDPPAPPDHALQMIAEARAKLRGGK